MLQKTGCYDPEMLQKLAASLTGEDASAETKVQQYKISLNDLCPGQILLNDVRTSDDVLLVAAGNEVTEVLIQRICNYAEHVGVQLPLTVDSLMPTESRSE